VNKKIKRILRIVFWVFFCTSVISLMSITQKKIQNTSIDSPFIRIHVEDENVFLTEQELKKRLEQKKLIFPGQRFEELDIEKIETFVANMEEVRSVVVYQYLNGTWHLEIQLRTPIAYLFAKGNDQYFIDSQGEIISSTPQHLARILIVTGNIPSRQELYRERKVINNSKLITIEMLAKVYQISNYICNDGLMKSLIGQVHLNNKNDFILIPLIGEQQIIFGTAHTQQEVEDKFDKLKIFYKEALPYEGWNKYSEISLKYDGQIVCKKKNND